MDYKAFLQPTAHERVLPYFGGTRLDAADRRFVVPSRGTDPLAPGWYRFQIDGRRAAPLEPAAPAELAALPALRGHFVGGWVVANRRALGRLALPPGDEPPALARVTARRWYSGDWLFDSLDFEDDAEREARRALEARRPLGAVKGVVPSLRAAFGYALGLAAAEDLRIPMTIHELSPIVVEIADGGVDVVRQLFDDLVAERRAQEAALRERARQQQLGRAASRARVVPRAASVRERCDDVLDAAGARLVGFRLRERGTHVEVTYTVDGTRLVSVVDPESLAVLDPGLCLGHGGEYRVLTLDAMPSVVREAIATGRLNIYH